MTPLVSVIIPTYNGEVWVQRAISSVLSQSYQKIELIIVDDYSSDGTLEVIAQAQRYDDRIKIFKHTKNLGVGAARNTGLHFAQGDYIAFLDQDDFWLPGKLITQVKALLESPADVALCYTNYYIQHAGGDCVPFNAILPDSGGELIGELMLFCRISFSTTLFRRKDLLEIGGFETCLSGCDDWDLLIKLAGKGKKMLHLPDFSAVMTLHEHNQRFQKSENIIAKSCQVLDRHLNDPQVLSQLSSWYRAKILLSRGYCYSALNEMRKAREDWLHALSLNPSLLSFRLLAWLLLTSLPGSFPKIIIKSIRDLRKSSLFGSNDW
ncbi:glycosyltransferase [Pyrinomonas methylaliphatogenes]|uniref:Glycosyl transferase n=1 Tax=Pyrinomonas methylaliphatogenes TaxID=454194 RepID=A0A0B6WWI9_9BACT|nr:glycosyltransferase [Pyrinomonas methylaliphatogenes]CDM65087.1 glycosyl transferase [Pyrinomonas methylaliphatogenes]